MDSAQGQVDAYVRRLRSALQGMTVGEREEIVEEIHGHIDDRLREGISAEDVLERLGTAEELGGDYRQGLLVRRASGSFSPWAMLGALWRLGLRGVQGLAVFLIAVTGYGSGFAFFVAGLAKPFFPEEVGLWVGPGAVSFGYSANGPLGGHELLGPWFAVVAFVLGALAIIVTSLILRALIPRYGQWMARFKKRPGMESALAAEAVR